MKHVTSIGYRRPRESGGPEPAPGLNRGQPFEPCGPWVPAVAGMTDKRLILRKSLWFRLRGIILPGPPTSATHEAWALWTRTCCESQTRVTQRSFPDDDH